MVFCSSMASARSGRLQRTRAEQLGHCTRRSLTRSHPTLCDRGSSVRAFLISSLPQPVGSNLSPQARTRDVLSALQQVFRELGWKGGRPLHLPRSRGPFRFRSANPETQHFSSASQEDPPPWYGLLLEQVLIQSLRTSGHLLWSLSGHPPMRKRRCFQANFLCVTQTCSTNGTSTSLACSLDHQHG